MRSVGCLLGALILSSAGLSTTFGQAPAAEKPAAVQPTTEKAAESRSGRQYAVKCRFIGEGMNNLTTPEVIVKEGEKKFVADTQSKSVLIGKKTDKAKSQAKRDLAEGITLDILVQDSEDDQAILDLSVELSCIDGDAKKGQVRVNAEKFRVLDCVTLDKQTTADFGHFSLEMMVSALPERQPEPPKTAAVPPQSGQSN